MDGDRGNGPERSATERADELLSRAGQTVGMFAFLIGTRVARVAAFAREEAEDMLAEARSIRERNLGAQTGGAEATTDASTGAATAQASSGEEETGQSARPDGRADGIKATDAARRHARELGVDLGEIEGTGAGGQITVEDVRKRA